MKPRGDREETRANGAGFGEGTNTASIRPNVRLDEWVVMPNHVHGIVVIEYRVDAAAVDANLAVNRLFVAIVETPRRGVSTGPSDQPDRAWKPNTLGAIINHFKGACTRRIRRAGYPDFAWEFSVGCIMQPHLLQ